MKAVKAVAIEVNILVIYLKITDIAAPLMIINLPGVFGAPALWAGELFLLGVDFDDRRSKSDRLIRRSVPHIGERAFKFRALNLSLNNSILLISFLKIRP